MNIKFLNVALGVALTATTLSATAQKVYKEGVITSTTSMRGMDVQPKMYFTADSTAMAVTMGAANVKVITDSKMSYLAVLLDVPVASMKKAGIATPAELEDGEAQLPKFTFAPTTETKQISGFNCKKVVATDSKTNKKYDIWVTNDVSLPTIATARYYQGIGGFPIKYTSFSQGEGVEVTITGITEQKVPAGTFGISKDYQKGTLAELSAQ